MIECQADWRRIVSSHMTQPRHERRKPSSDPRACAAPLEWQPPQPGAIRPSPGEVVAVERRRYHDAGME